MNNCTFVGRLGHDVSMRYTPVDFDEGERAVGRFSLALGRKGNGTDWIECVAFGSMAETINRFFHKGSRISIRCHVKVDYGKEDENGKRAKYTNFVVDEFDFMDDRKSAETGIPAGFEKSDDDAPF